VLAVVSAAEAQFPVTYKTVADWETGFNGQISVRNDTAQPLRSWQLEFDFARRIESIWDARIVSQSGGRYVIRGAAWNDVIGPGQSVTFGFGGSPGGVTRGPENFKVTAGADPPPAGAAAVVTVRETGRWMGGFSASVQVPSPGDAPWSLWLALDASVDSAWGATMTRGEGLYVFAGTGAVFGFTGAGVLGPVSRCRFNRADCAVTLLSFQAAAQPRPPISIEGDTESEPVTQIALRPGLTSLRLRVESPAAPRFRAVSANPGVARASIRGDLLELEAMGPGSTSVRIDDAAGGASRTVGVKVGQPGLPPYLALGSVSEDTADHLDFWRSIDTGPRNRRMDIRYIYLNGGPVNGWDTWGASPGSRAVNYIRNSRMLGMIPFFVWYNIPDGSESYELDLAHVQSPGYMTAYFGNLRLFLDIVRRDAAGDTVGMILEPDFLGYLAQNAGQPAERIRAATHAAYDSGLLGSADPRFPDTVQGLVQAINYAISRKAPNILFGWQMNLWASPAGGWTTAIPARGLIRKTDEAGIDAGREAIRLEAAAIARYYLDAGVADYGAHFLSIDKYGLDAVGLESHAAADPASSIWFWNSDHWHNYLAFVRAVHETARLPIVLWQLPVGRINRSLEENPYESTGRFAELANTHQRYEDSAAPFFFGDTFAVSGPRRDYFGSNLSGDPGVTTGEETVAWRPHMEDAVRAGVRAILFGAGVGASTSGTGVSATDGFWWITKAQRYFSAPVPIDP